MTSGKKTSVFENALIWFGAGVSLAEIQTGTYFASLGMMKGAAAVILGHLIGCVILFAAGLIGAGTGKSAMETVKGSFGRKGAMFFAVLNVLQLVGWTAIMIYDGSLSAEAVLPAGRWIWCLLTGALIIVWILIGIQNLGRLNTAAMILLFGLTVVLCTVIFRGSAKVSSDEVMSFGAAVELAAAMPLSWLPLISDYTREAEKPVASTAVSAGVYGVVSCWMYFIGMGAAIFAGESDLAQIILRSGLGVAGLLIIILSTVTTTFLDAFSAGISSESFQSMVSGKKAAIITAVIGTLGAVFFPMGDITDFLYLIGSVFAPMAAIQITDHFILKRDSSDKGFDPVNMFIWLAGFIIYRLLMRMDIPVGNTLPDMVITMLICMALTRAGNTRHN